MVTCVAWVACFPAVPVLVHVTLDSGIALVVKMDDVFVVLIVCCVAFACFVAVSLFVHVTVAFGGSVVLKNDYTVLVVFVGCTVVAPLFDGVIVCCTGSDTHVLMMVDYNVSVVLVD